ncbi:ABC transporter permease [Ruania alba]|uniref:Osmoprotectant transport system permease protein n=1 Tax=Ruania alba TaxID=648782 RepID=A0A1H5GPG1_9MICO|nr:ABC transporter permease [Ruania alba]SEE17607.1 osmoprotectant transport system permease protein [Ruania alba]
MSLLDFVVERREDLLEAALGHLTIVGVSLLCATVIGVLLAVLTYRSRLGSSLAVGSTSIILMVPSFALLGLLIPPFGLGFTPVAIALTLYALLPIVRNATVALRTNDAAVLEAAAGVGMGRLSSLLRVELPLAWPVILAGIRFSAQLILGIATVAAYVNGPGFGQLVFRGLSTFGGPNSLNLALSGTFGVLVLAIMADLAFAALRRLTIPEVRRG